MESTAGQFLEFESFCLDPAERKLTKGGQVVPLPPKAFDLLLVLVNQSGHLLTKEVIMQTLWPDTFVEEANLANYVSHLRKALGKTVDRREYIETVQRSGYRFRGTVSVRCTATSDACDIRRLAVLPFSDLDCDRENDSFRDGLTEELINELVQIRGLRVAARTSVWQFRDQNVDVRNVGRALDVDALVEGSVRRYAESFRITAQLVRCSDGCHSWSKSYDRPSADPLKAQREVSLAIAGELRARFLSQPAATRTPASGSPVRLIVLPFRVLKPDAETDFLSRSLAEAIADDMACLDSVVVRSSLAAERYVSPMTDLWEIASVAQVDVVLTGTLVRLGSRLRFSVQLIEVPEGKVRWSISSEIAAGDFLELREEIVRGAIGALNTDLTSKERSRLSRGIPTTCRAYEFYLRANQTIRSRTLENFVVARDMYRECLAEDPEYAPAWAQLGRCYRFLGKFAGEEEDTTALAEQSLQRALEIQPHNSLARNVYALLQADFGRAGDAMRDLLLRANECPNDAKLYTGLVQACRFCGELAASVRAHERARELDPNEITSVEHTWFLRSEYERALAMYPRRSGFYMDAAALAVLGREREASAVLMARRKANVSFGPVQVLMDSLQAILDADRCRAVLLVEEAIPAAKRLRELESVFYMARHLAYLGAVDHARDLVSWAITHGFCCSAPLEGDPWLESLRAAPGFGELLRASRALERINHEAFIQAGGPEILTDRQAPLPV